MESKIDSHPDADVYALQTVDALLRRTLMELRPALLRAEQRQRDREFRRDRAAKGAQEKQQRPDSRSGRCAGSPAEMCQEHNRSLT